MIEQRKITKHISNVTLGTFISRILGYIRDMLVAELFGAGFIADAFYAAYRIPNLFRRLLGEGSISASFIPVLTEYIETKDKEETHELINVVFTILLTIVLLITIIGIIFAKPITKLITWGFFPDKIELTASLTRILFPYMIFVCMAALMLGILNSLKSFFIPAVAPALLNISEIVYVLFFSVMISLPEMKIKWLAVSILIGGFGQYLIQQICVLKKGYIVKLKYDFNHPGLKKIFLLMIPITLGFSVDQINAFVDTICGSFLADGSIAALYYSNRLMQLPLALFGLAITTVALPTMSSGVAKNDINKVKETLNFSLRMIFFTLIPCMFGLVVLGLPIVKLLFERGRFDAKASEMTYSALAFYSLGLIAFSSTKVLSSVFYSFKTTKLPFKIAVICMMINVILNIVLMKPLHVGGLALATTISSWVNCTLLLYYLRKKIGGIGGRKIFVSFLKITGISIIMSLFAYLLFIIEYPYYILKVCIPIIFAVIFYIYLSKILKIEEYNIVQTIFVKKDISIDTE